MNEEEWRDVPGYEGKYLVSSQGRVRSLTQMSKAEFINGRKVKGGHVRVALYRNGSATDYLLHRLVLIAFIGPPPPDKPEALHWDDNPENNYLSNLRWGSRGENLIDAVRNGRNPQANKTHCSRGHPFDMENTYIETKPTGRTRRVCKTCKRVRDRRRRGSSDG